MHPPMTTILAEQTLSPEQWSVGSIDVFAEPPLWFFLLSAAVFVASLYGIVKALRG